jgi:class 3 adenylate cyclase
VSACPSCGKELSGEFAFCPFCGAALSEQPAPTLQEERKIVTVLFCDLVGFTAASDAADPEDVRARIRPYHARLRQEIERYGGTVEKFVGDAVMAVFGAPVAHEDDPERAVRAALAIRDWARDQEDVQVRIAVNTGEALINLDARPESGEGMAAGDVVNTAARMQTAAPTNGIVVGEATYRATRGAIDYREAGTIELERTLANVATLVQPNQPTHDISLPRRSLRDCLAEELRRLDPDDLYGEVLTRGVLELGEPDSDASADAATTAEVR